MLLENKGHSFWLYLCSRDPGGKNVKPGNLSWPKCFVWWICQHEKCPLSQQSAIFSSLLVTKSVRRTIYQVWKRKSFFLDQEVFFVFRCKKSPLHQKNCVSFFGGLKLGSSTSRMGDQPTYWHFQGAKTKSPASDTNWGGVSHGFGAATLLGRFVGLGLSEIFS